MAQQRTRTGSSNLPRTLYLGPEASFSHQAAVEALPNTQPIPLPSFNAIITAIEKSGPNFSSEEIYDYAVLPVENSTNGSVVQALDLLARCRLCTETKTQFWDVGVIGEHYLEVHHCLFVSRAWAEQRLTKEELDLLDAGQDEALGRKRLEQLLPKLNIKTLYTHPQVWGQCNNFLSSLLPPGHVDRVDLSSTSAAAAYVANHPPNTQDDQNESGIAAISSSLAGAKHGRDLICLARNIEDEPGANTTRFLILRNRVLTPHDVYPSHVSGEMPQVKSLFTFTIKHHQPGSLAEALAVFAKHGFNLTAIQSRPQPKFEDDAKFRAQYGISEPDEKLSKWNYVFFIECLYRPRDVASMREEDQIQDLWEELKTVTSRRSVLGSWPII